MLALSSLSRVAAAIERARSVTLVAYLLPRGTIVDALADAARRGARVTVRLEGKPYFDSSGGVARLNRAVVDELARAGADAHLVDDDGTKPQLHAKAVLVDGTLYLDNVNFARSGTILRDDRRADARALRDAVADRIDPPTRSFALRKVDALRLEAAALDAARRRDRIEVETESAGSGNAVYARLERLGRAGLRPRLLVSREALTTKERSLLHRLQSSGVRVRVCASNEKFAVAGRNAWLGSANATSPFPDTQQLDWGARTKSRSIASYLRARFEARWQSARELSA